MTDGEKMKSILTHYNMTPARFAAKIGLHQDTIINSILQGNYKISKVVRKKITTFCPEISIYWLTTGEGEMITKDCNSSKPMTAGEQINCILDDLGMRAAEFAKSIGLNNQNIYDIQRGRSKMSRNVVKKIRDSYPEMYDKWIAPNKSIVNNNTALEFCTLNTGDGAVINPTADIAIKAKISLLEKDVESWKARYELAQQLIDNQKMLIDVLTKHNE